MIGNAFAEAEVTAQKALADFNFGRKTGAQPLYWLALEKYKAAKEKAQVALDGGGDSGGTK